MSRFKMYCEGLDDHQSLRVFSSFYDPEHYHVWLQGYQSAQCDEAFNWENSKTNILVNKDEYVQIEFKFEDLVYDYKARKTNSQKDIWEISYDLEHSNSSNRVSFERLKSGMVPNSIFAAIIKCTDILIKEKQPKFLEFRTADERLQKFYMKFVSSMIKRLPLERTELDGPNSWRLKIKEI